MQAKCMAETLGHMLQDIKNNYPNKYPAAMRTVKSWKNYSFIGFTPTMREKIDKVWIEPNTWNDGKMAAMAYVPLLEIFMKQYEDGKNEEGQETLFIFLNDLQGYTVRMWITLSQIERVIARIMSFCWRQYVIS